MKKTTCFCVLISIFVMAISTQSAAHAADSPVASIYMDAPFVQGSYASDENSGAVNVTTETFEYSEGACPTQLTVGTIDPQGNCIIHTGDPYFGGATTTSSDPYDLGSHSSYPSDFGPFTITFPSPKKYVGFWWSAGNPQNQVSFLDASGNVLAMLDGRDLYSAVTAATIKNRSGDLYSPEDYLGHPGERITLEDGSQSRYDQYEPFVYIHAFAQGASSFNSIQIAGSGFEFDNLTTADTAPDVNQRSGLVSIRDIYALSVLPAPSPNPGYGFGGWYSDEALTNYIGYPGDFYYPSNFPIYPSWSPNWINIIYTDVQSDFTCYDGRYYGDPRTILDNTGLANPDGCGIPVVKEGYTLSGWNTAPDGSGQSYSFGDPYTGTDDLTLYPVWSTSTPPPVSSSLHWNLGRAENLTPFISDVYSTQNVLTLSSSFDSSISVSDPGTVYMVSAPLTENGTCGDFTTQHIVFGPGGSLFTFNIVDGGESTSTTLVRGQCYRWSEDSSRPIATDNSSPPAPIDFDTASLTSGILKLPPKISAHWPSTIPVDPRSNTVDLPAPSAISGAASIHFCVMQGTSSGSKGGTTLSFAHPDLQPISGDSAFSLERTVAEFSSSVNRIQVSTSDAHKFLTDSYVLVRTLPAYRGATSHCDSDPSNPFEIQPLDGESATIKVAPYGLTRTLVLPTIDLGHHK